ncbi:MAG TPA: M23 family metallopeptidase, partial [Thermopetrobacter sp.]|nr:M23 family metallopeptidase [Thermopetrobacter sp.]
MGKPLSFRMAADAPRAWGMGSTGGMAARRYAMLGVAGLLCGLGATFLVSLPLGGGLPVAEANGDAKQIVRPVDPLADPGLTTASISGAGQRRADMPLIRHFARPEGGQDWMGDGAVRQASFAPPAGHDDAAYDGNQTVILKTLPADPVDEVIELKAGDSLIERLEKLGIARSVAAALIKALNAIRPVADIPPGTRINVTIDRQQGFYGYDEAWPVYLSYPVGKGVKVVVEADDEGVFTARVVGGVMVMRQFKEPLRKVRGGAKRDERRLARRVISAPSANKRARDKAKRAAKVLRARGRVSSSLYAALKDRKVPEYIIRAVMRAFSYDVDFQRQVHKGTRFDILYGPPLSGSSKRRKVLYYATLEPRGRRYVFYRFTTPRGHTGFFDPRGRSAVKALLRMPVSGVRISSGFGYRRHPILGYTKLHTGIDFAAPRGTPIRAAGGGVIAHAGWRGGYGRAVVIRHGKKMTTLYAHMSRIARGIRRGGPVRQGQV